MYTQPSERPLHSAPVTDCEHCEKPLSEKGYYTLDGFFFCRDCAVVEAAHWLLGSGTGPFGPEDRKALAILSQYVHEQSKRRTL